MKLFLALFSCSFSLAAKSFAYPAELFGVPCELVKEDDHIRFVLFG